MAAIIAILISLGIISDGSEATQQMIDDYNAGVYNGDIDMF